MPILPPNPSAKRAFPSRMAGTSGGVEYDPAPSPVFYPACVAILSGSADRASEARTPPLASEDTYQTTPWGKQPMRAR